jgi:hypothetical protein
VILGLLAPSAPALLVAALALSNPSDEFDRGRTAFFRAEYQRAISTLEPLLYPELKLESEEEVVQAHRMLGVSYLFENQPDHARSEFRKLLELQPDFRFDPLLDPPRVVDFFNGVVKEQQDELGDIEVRLKKREAALAAQNSRVIERRIERRSFVLNFVPFGAGQFQNQQKRKGLIFLGIESALLATSLATFATNFALYGVRPVRPCFDQPETQPSGAPWVCPPDRIDHSGEDFSRTLMRVQVASGVLFFAVAAWGIVDAIRNFQGEVVVGETTAGPQPAPAPASVPVSSLGTPETDAAPPRRPPPSVRRLMPSFAPLAQGGLLSLTY